MIESIEIRNFQKHDNIKIDLAPITSIVGSTDAGKSAILRGLRWLCLNKPSGDAFIKKGRSGVSVRVRLGRDRITRTKTKASSGNHYKLNNKKFTAFGNAVPEEIAKLLNVTEDNFQKQLSGPYWLELSSGQVAKELNRVINLELIDKCQANISSELRKAKAIVEVTKDRLEVAKREVEELSWAREANKSFQIISDKQKAVDFKLIKLDRLRQIQGEGREYEKTLQNAAAVKYSDLNGGLDRIMGLKKRLNTLQEMDTQIGRVRRDLCRKKESLKQAQSDLDEKMKGDCPICLRPIP